MKRAVVVAASAGLALALAACGNKGNQYGDDAPRTGAVNRGAAEIGTMPDGFSNYASKCDHGNRIYVMFHGDADAGSIFVVANAAGCGQ